MTLEARVVRAVTGWSKNQHAPDAPPANRGLHLMPGQVLAMLQDYSPLSWGSREDMNLHFCQLLTARGVRSVLVYSEDIPEDIRQKYKANGIEIAPPMNYGRGLWKYYRQLGKLIRDYRVTTVHIAFFNYFSLVPWMARSKGVRHILYHERNPGTSRAKSWRRHLLRLRGRLSTLPMTRIAAISRFVKEQLVTLGVPEHKISLVYNGIDTQRYFPDSSAKQRLLDRFSLPPGEIILTTLSFLKPHKNIDTVIEACGQLGHRGVSVRLFVIGEGPLRQRLEALCKSLRITDRVQWLGHISDPVPILQACDIFLMASLGEGFGLALAEAMACGAACVAADSGALREIVEHGKSGLLVPPRDSTALADAVESLAKNEKLRSQMSRLAVERVRRYFALETSIEEMIKSYQIMWSSLNRPHRRGVDDA